ncbi:MAG: hypothetical protein WCR46_07215 [Deltaproteobacteria bacterium]
MRDPVMYAIQRKRGKVDEELIDQVSPMTAVLRLVQSAIQNAPLDIETEIPDFYFGAGWILEKVSERIEAAIKTTDKKLEEICPMRNEMANTIQRVKTAIKNRIEFHGIFDANNHIFSDYDFVDTDAVLELTPIEGDYDANFEKLVSDFTNIAKMEFDKLMASVQAAAELTRQADKILKAAFA